MTDFIRLIQELAAENNGALGISVVKDGSYKIFVSNRHFSSDDLYRIAKHARKVMSNHICAEQWEIPMPATEVEKLILESNLYLLCLKVLGKTKSKA